MPVYGEKISKHGTEYISPVFSINYLGKNPDGKGLISIGAGFGGANHKRAYHYIGTEISEQPIFDALGKEMWWPSREGGVGNYNIRVPEDMFNSIFSRLRSIRRDLDSKINSLIELTGQRYLEIVSNGACNFNWVVVQSAPIKINTINKCGVLN